jgi:hypothetical protein
MAHAPVVSGRLARILRQSAQEHTAPALSEPWFMRELTTIFNLCCSTTFDLRWLTTLFDSVRPALFEPWFMQESTTIFNLRCLTMSDLHCLTMSDLRCLNCGSCASRQCLTGAYLIHRSNMSYTRVYDMIYLHISYIVIRLHHMSDLLFTHTYSIRTAHFYGYVLYPDPAHTPTYVL